MHDREGRARRTYDDHVTLLTQYAVLLAGPTDGPDLVQEAFAILFAHHGWETGQLDDGRSGSRRMAAFLRSTVQNRYRMLGRSSSRRRARDLRAFLRDERDRTHEDTIAYVENATVHQALQHLDGRQAEAVRLRLIGLTPKEIGDEMGVAGATASKHLKRGFAKVKLFLDLEKGGRR